MTKKFCEMKAGDEVDFRPDPVGFWERGRITDHVVDVEFAPDGWGGAARVRGPITVAFVNGHRFTDKDWGRRIRPVNTDLMTLAELTNAQQTLKAESGKLVVVPADVFERLCKTAHAAADEKNHARTLIDAGREIVEKKNQEIAALRERAEKAESQLTKIRSAAGQLKSLL